MRNRGAALLHVEVERLAEVLSGWLARSDVTATS